MNANQEANGRLPLSLVPAFCDEAEKVGCYKRTQRTNYETALRLFMDQVASGGGTPSELPVSAAYDMISRVLRQYGNKANASAASLKTYESRVKKLLKDFVTYHDGDFVAWKEQIGASRTKVRRRSISTVPIAPSAISLPTAKQSHRIVLSRGREGTLSLPVDLTASDIDPIWAQLSALRGLIEAQIAAVEDKVQKPAP